MKNGVGNVSEGPQYKAKPHPVVVEDHPDDCGEANQDFEEQIKHWMNLSINGPAQIALVRVGVNLCCVNVRVAQ